MTIITRIIAGLLFVFFFSFALKNTDPVSVHLFLQYEVSGPLVLVLLAFLVIGAFLGILAMTPVVFHHRRETLKVKAALESLQQTNAAQEEPKAVQPDIVGNPL